MPPTVDLVYDAAWALSPGRREQQEDSVVADFPVGSGLGFAVLADGMGGHAAGDVASKIVVTEVFSELKMLSNDPEMLEENIQVALRQAVLGANFCVEQFAKQNPEASGMGATLVAPVLFDDRLYWISVGDSPLFLFRDGHLSQINENHSWAAKIDLMCSQGLIDRDEAARHPDRQCLTSALAGHEIPHMDCSETPLFLKCGDIVIAASDGLQFLADAQIEQILKDHSDRPSAEISAVLLRNLKDLDHPEQDNVSMCIIKMNQLGDTASIAAKPSSEPVAERRQEDEQRVKSLTVLVRKSKPSECTTYCVSQKERA
ncbi:PP2C-family Ser/Thr phosphatase [Roseovarius litorisediminis]|uniref:PP2C-family Ser/Thr phosphatase n=1 Tax=Roseovarius litorisediminis TaxID=1312363 RepID=A0A1Y5T1D9_9RHOB|nr:protein phosphatase 2C domain-containing protein [Roseovarius litorisediminis]SLN53715.1 PP2C-family Ser/Thr phosphatase [Roseovarius litorisediminis]